MAKKKKKIAKPNLKKIPAAPKAGKAPKAGASLAVWKRYNESLKKKADDYRETVAAIKKGNDAKQKKYDASLKSVEQKKKDMEKTKSDVKKNKSALAGLGGKK